MIFYKKKIAAPDAEWIVMIHGMGGSINTWKYQVEALDKEYNLFLFDLDGHGNSDYNEESTDYKPYQMAVMLNELLEKEKISEFHIVAFSLGTEVAMEYVRLFPDKIKRLVLGGPVLNCSLAKKGLFRFARFLSIVLPLKISYGICARIIMPKKNHKRGRSIFIREALKMRKKAFTSWLVKLSGTKQKINQYVDAINSNLIPTIFITGNEDYMFLKGTRKLASRINNSSLEVIADCGHICVIEKRDIFNEETIKFLKNIDT